MTTLLKVIRFLAVFQLHTLKQVTKLMLERRDSYLANAVSLSSLCPLPIRMDKWTSV